MTAWSLIGWAGTGAVACNEPEPAPKNAVENQDGGADAEQPATPPAAGEDAVVEPEDVPLEPSVQLVKAGKGAEQTLPRRAPGARSPSSSTPPGIPRGA